MILDRLDRLDRYAGLSPHMDRAIAYIRAADLNRLPLGRAEVAGDLVHFNHFQYTTSPQTQESLFEAHRAFLDLHVVLSGQEWIAVAPVESLTLAEDRPEEDAVLYRGDGQLLLPLPAGWFALLYPGEGHLPRLSGADAPSAVDKIVFKIRT